MNKVRLVSITGNGVIAKSAKERTLTQDEIDGSRYLGITVGELCTDYLAHSGPSKPTAAELSGNFSDPALPIIYDPLTVCGADGKRLSSVETGRLIGYTNVCTISVVNVVAPEALSCVMLLAREFATQT